MLKKTSPLVRWLLAANILLLAILAIKYIPRAEDRYAKTKHDLRAAGLANAEEADVLMGKDTDAIIDLFERLVAIMPSQKDRRWRTRLSVVSLRLGVDKSLSSAQRARINGISKRLIQEGRAKGNPDAQADGALWVARYGSPADLTVLQPLLTSQDPQIRASAEKAVKRLTDAKA